MNYLSVSADAKTIKGEKRGYLTGILYLAPAESSGAGNVCTDASDGCKRACLFTAGRGVFPSVHDARVRRTEELFSNRSKFVAELVKDVQSLICRASKLEMIPCVRLNGTSDLPWLAHTLAEQFPDVQFYDYTKHPRAWTRTRPNYHLTFSRSETNARVCLDNLAHGVNVAVVFDTARTAMLPAEWNGYQVVDGDTSDLRFLDPCGVVVGLRAKGRARHDCSGFVQATGPLVQIQSEVQP